ncbi:hypothetical protein RhiJN_26560 [Ceratobasidium sp. AG-Ba]|nr:hypothetical protein RhiJN_26560 [Ceratobasidium sp. AG-Ba]
MGSNFGVEVQPKERSCDLSTSTRRPGLPSQQPQRAGNECLPPHPRPRRATLDAECDRPRAHTTARATSAPATAPTTSQATTRQVTAPPDVPRLPATPHLSELDHNRPPNASPVAPFPTTLLYSLYRGWRGVTATTLCQHGPGPYLATRQPPKNAAAVAYLLDLTTRAVARAPSPTGHDGRHGRLGHRRPVR